MYIPTRITILRGTMDTPITTTGTLTTDSTRHLITPTATIGIPTPGITTITDGMGITLTAITTEDEQWELPRNLTTETIPNLRNKELPPNRNLNTNAPKPTLPLPIDKLNPAKNI